MWWALSNPLKPEENHKADPAGRKENSSFQTAFQLRCYCCCSWLWTQTETLALPESWTFLHSGLNCTISSLVLRPLNLVWSYTTNYLLLVASQLTLPTSGLVSLHNHRSQFCTINVSLSLSVFLSPHPIGPVSLGYWDTLTIAVINIIIICSFFFFCLELIYWGVPVAEFVGVWYLQRIYLSVLTLIDICSVWDYYNINLRIIINNTDMDIPLHVSCYEWT